ncbi:hypothetical protein [uncultured Victivallis sp.]|uniref:hypothetical protein n=1 Tax=uncultured Victivallis sp. TaxID=354118 RepID=UPI0025EA0875|nr:hypothetical protein [uncultured Victivallis sp.]
MKIFGILGIAAAAVLAADAADVTISGMTGNAQTDTLKLYAKNRTAKGNFTIAAMPAALVGETIVSVPRGQSAQPGTAYSVTIDQPARVYLLVQNRGKVTIPEDWKKTNAVVAWGDGFSDTVYVKDLDAPGTIEVPAHNGKQGSTYGIPNALVITAKEKPAASGVTESRLMPKSRLRTADARFTFVKFPDSLKGQPCFSIPRGAQNQPGAAYSITLKKPAKLYLLVQERGNAAIPEGWTKIDEKCSWKNNSETYTDSIYTKDFPAGVAEIPAHNGKLGNSFGIPNAVVVRYK